RPGHRRFRAPARRTAGSAEPLDRPAREPRGLPDAQHGPEVRAAVHDARRLRDQHPAAGAGRRGVPPPHPLQGPLREPQLRGLHRHLPELLHAEGHPVQTRARRRPARQLLQATQHRPPRLPPARPHRAVAGARRVSRQAAGPDSGAPARRVRQLLRRREHGGDVHAAASAWMIVRLPACLLAVLVLFHASAASDQNPDPATASAADAAGAPAAVPPPLSIRITSPLGRTGTTGAVRIVAQVTAAENVTLSAVRFYVDDKLVGEDATGPVYAVEWVDENPFEARVIRADVADSAGNIARD